MHTQLPEKCRNVVSPHPTQHCSISPSASFTPERYFPITQQNLKDIRHLLSKASCPAGKYKSSDLYSRALSPSFHLSVLVFVFVILSVAMSDNLTEYNRASLHRV